MPRPRLNLIPQAPNASDRMTFFVINNMVTIDCNNL